MLSSSSYKHKTGRM